MQWRNIDWMKLSEQVVYFLLAIVFFNSIGIWLPLGIDYWNYDKLTTATYEATPYNIMTYFLGMVTVAIIDRIKRILNMQNHPSRFLEILGWIVFVVLAIGLAAVIMKYVKNKAMGDAIKLSVYGTVATYIVWWIAYSQPIKSNPYGALGHENIS